MATVCQINANRRNAFKSTGTKNTGGKARSSQNALFHGLASKQIVLSTGDEAASRPLRAPVNASSSSKSPSPLGASGASRPWKPFCSTIALSSNQDSGARRLISRIPAGLSSARRGPCRMATVDRTPSNSCRAIRPGFAAPSITVGRTTPPERSVPRPSGSGV